MITKYISVLFALVHLIYFGITLITWNTEVAMRIGAVAFLSLFIVIKRSESYIVVWLELPMQFLMFLWVIGRFYYLYENVWWYDEMTHFVGPAMITLYSLYLFRKFIPTRVPEWLFTFAIVNFGITLAVIWEFYEFYLCYEILKAFEMDLPDTMSDLVLGFMGATMVGVWYFYRARINAFFSDDRRKAYTLDQAPAEAQSYLR